MGEMIKVSVCGLPKTCWRCHGSTTVVVGMLPVVATYGGLVTCYDERILAAAADLLRAAGLARIAGRSGSVPAVRPGSPN
jgi:hypothetical protein